MKRKALRDRVRFGDVTRPAGCRSGNACSESTCRCAPTAQQVVRSAEQRRVAADATTLFVNGLTREEVDTLRARFLYSGCSDDYIATYSSQLAVATQELLALRGRKKARVRMTPSGLVLTCKAAVRRFAACAPIMLALVLAGCLPAVTTTPPRVGPYPPTLPVHYLAVWLEPTVAGATVTAVPTALGAPIALPLTNADGWSGAPATQGDYLVRAEKDGYEAISQTVTVTKHTDLHLKLVRSVAPTLPVRVDGRFFVTDNGTVRPIFQSGLSLLARGPPERDAFLDETRALGFSGVRVFAGDLGWAGQTPASARAALPGLLDAAQARGLYVFVSAITGSRSAVYDYESHLRDVAAIVAAHPNALLEVANETYHATQSDEVNDPARLAALARRAIPAGQRYALGAPPYDEPQKVVPSCTENCETYWPQPLPGGFVTVHLDRGRDLWNQVRRVRELEMISSTTKTPVFSGEPIGIGETTIGGKRYGGEEALRFSFTYGALCRGFEIACVWHSEDGLNAVPLKTVQRQAAADFIAGWHAIDTTERLRFVNAGWSDTPVKGANFDSGLVRAYSFVTGNAGYTVLVGVEGDPAVQWANGWHPVSLSAERAGVQVWRIAR